MEWIKQHWWIILIILVVLVITIIVVKKVHTTQTQNQKSSDAGIANATGVTTTNPIVQENIQNAISQGYSVGDNVTVYSGRNMSNGAYTNPNQITWDDFIHRGTLGIIITKEYIVHK